MSFGEFVRSRQGVQFFAMASEAFRAVPKLVEGVERVAAQLGRLAEVLPSRVVMSTAAPAAVQSVAVNLLCKPQDLKTLRRALELAHACTDDETMRERMRGMQGVVQLAIEQVDP